MAIRATLTCSPVDSNMSISRAAGRSLISAAKSTSMSVFICCSLRLDTAAVGDSRSAISEGSGVICLNGAAAHGNDPGDLVILSIFGDMDDAEARAWRPKVVFCDEHNRAVPVDAERAGPAMPRRLEA